MTACFQPTRRCSGNAAPPRYSDSDGAPPDDAYEPGLAIANAEKLVEQDGVVALIGVTGTPTVSAMFDYVVGNRIPLLAPLTGARFLRVPYQRYVINMRAGYDDEVLTMVNHCIGQGRSRISIFFQVCGSARPWIPAHAPPAPPLTTTALQDDGFGKVGIDALKVALTNYGLSILSNGSYPRNTDNVTVGLNQLRDSINSPQCVVMIGAATALAKFVRQAKAVFPGDVLYYSVSFVGPEKLVALLHDTTANVFITQVRARVAERRRGLPP